MPKTLRVRTKTGWVTKPIADLPENRLLPHEVDDNFLNIEQQLEDHNNSTTSHPHLVNAVYEAAAAAEAAMAAAILAKDQAEIVAGDSFQDLTGYIGATVKVNQTGDGFDYRYEPITLTTAWNGILIGDLVLMRAPIPIHIRIPHNFIGSIAICETPATIQVVLLVLIGGIQVGTISFPPGSLVGIFSSETDIDVAANSVIKIISPATPDSTLANIGITILGER